MTKLRWLYLILISSFLQGAVYFFSWNIGHDVGYVSGYNSAVIEMADNGTLKVECKFPRKKCDETKPE